MRRPPGVDAEGGRAGERGGLGQHFGRRTWHALDDLHFLAFTPHGGAGITLPLAQRLSIVWHAIVTISYRGRPQDGADLHVARACLEAFGRAVMTGATILKDHVTEHLAVADRPANRARLAALVTKGLETFVLDLRCVCDSCGQAWA
ncbi:MAG: hypothetical protein ABJ111_01230 [Alphaproteobacteria bacterium]